ncbi:MAG: hypothetical protein IJ640_09390 [Prevotella sp.]|nr:hypothetical protein [Prevotella sp.]
MKDKIKKTTIEIIADNERLTLSKLAAIIECLPQNMYDIKSGKAKSVSASIADKIVSAFPKYSRTWVITGEGNMYSHPQSITGDGNVQVGGNASNVNAGAALDNAIKEISNAHALMAKMQEQMDRMLAVIENLSNTKMA